MEETLEEAAEKYKINIKEAIQFGAKWQQERMYSEEDMKQAYLDGCKIKLTNIYHLEKWFKQFKKK